MKKLFDIKNLEPFNIDENELKDLFKDTMMEPLAVDLEPLEINLDPAEDKPGTYGYKIGTYGYKIGTYEDKPGAV